MFTVTQPYQLALNQILGRIYNNPDYVESYTSNTVFRNAILAKVHGADELEILYHLAKIIEDKNAQIAELMESEVKSYYVNRNYQG